MLSRRRCLSRWTGPDKPMLIQDFLWGAFEMPQDDPRLEQVRSFMEGLFQYDPDDGILPTMGAVLSAVDLALERREALSTGHTHAERLTLEKKRHTRIFGSGNTHYTAGFARCV